MSANKRRLPKNMLNIVIALLIVVIIVAAVLYVATSPGESIVVVTPEEVINNSEEYIGDTISVEGFFYYNGPDDGYIRSTIASSGSSNYDPRPDDLPVDIEELNTSLSGGIKYRFTGVLTKVTSDYYNEAIILVADKFVEV